MRWLKRQRQQPLTSCAWDASFVLSGRRLIRVFDTARPSLSGLRPSDVGPAFYHGRRCNSAKVGDVAIPRGRDQGPPPTPEDRTLCGSEKESSRVCGCSQEMGDPVRSAAPDPKTGDEATVAVRLRHEADSTARPRGRARSAAIAPRLSWPD